MTSLAPTLPDWYVPCGLGKVLEAWRTGWSLLPETRTWCRLSLGPENKFMICEILPIGQDFPRTRGRYSYLSWWGEGGAGQLETTPQGLEMVQRFYVYRELAPFDEYTTFNLLMPEGTLIENSVSHEPALLVHHGKQKAIPQARMKLRFRILARDGFRCRYCGRAADATELQIDHVLPVSKGGKTVESNLVTSCRACNIGKGDVLLA